MVDIEDIKVKIETTDHVRSEENWHKRNEELVSRWRDHCAEMCKEHEKAAYSFTKKNKQWGVPTAVLPAACVLVTAVYSGPDDTLKYVVAPLTFCSTLMSVLYGVMAPSGRAAQHWAFNASYGEMTALIDTELSRAKQFRRPPDSFMAEFGTRINMLDGTAPPIPNGGWLPDIFCCSRDSKPRARLIDGGKADHNMA
jgi:hypothetical protein